MDSPLPVPALAVNRRYCNNENRSAASALNHIGQEFSQSQGAFSLSTVPTGERQWFRSENKTVSKKTIMLAIVLAVPVVTGSCGSTNPAPNDLPPISVECRTPVRVAIVLDQSTSMSTSGTASVEAEDLRQLIGSLAECGGALGVGFVRERPQPGMQRIEFPQPPLLPAAPVMQEDEQGYEFDDRVAAFNKLRVDQADAIKNVLEKKKPEIDGYFQRMEELLARPAAKGTDLNSTLNAADLFLAEPSNGEDWQKSLIIVSDGIDTGHKPRRPFSSGARVFWVNANSDDKVLSEYGATRVEALKAATDEVIAKLRRRGSK